MITNNATQLADALFHAVGREDVPPQWKKMPRPVKQQLMKKLEEKKYNNIHDPRFYQELDRMWHARRRLKEKDIADSVKLATKVDCPICLETYDGADKVSTLMCGHKYCSKCLFEHIHRLHESACCPLCRRNVFMTAPHTPTPNHETIPDRELLLRSRIQHKRRLERRNKRARKKENKNSI